VAGNLRQGASSEPEAIGLDKTITREFIASDLRFRDSADDTRDAVTEQGERGRVVGPQLAGDHTIGPLIGAGGMGSVYEAQAPDGTVVALKFIGDASPERLYRFKREFRALSGIVHPNLVELYELLQVDQDGQSSVFFTMERLHGEHFVAAVRRGHPPGGGLDEAGVRRLQDGLVGLASGLACIHRHGLVHRDVKPSNVMITAGGRVVVLDLGLVREVRSATFDSGAIVGTPLYMAPEQVVDAERVGPPADWYAVGEILWESLTGAPRHIGSMHAILEGKLTGAPRSPETEGVVVAPELARLCVELLARDPAARPGAAEVLTRLGRGDLVAIEVVSHGVVGRAGETAALLEVIAAARPGRPSAAAISGRSGLGKSTLVAHVAQHARRELGALVFTGQCSARESIPFKALDTALDELAIHLCDHPVELTDAPGAAALARLFPVLRSVPQIRGLADALLDGVDPVQVRRHAADALAELFERVADGRPLVLVLDNLQWADLDSVQLLESVLLRPQPPPLALLCTFHAGAEATRPPLMRLLASLRAMDRVTVHALALGPVSEDQASALAAHHLGLGPGDPMARRIARESHGSPFFVGELARFARGRGGLGDSVASLNLEDVLRMRLRGLPAAARRLVEVLAIAGGRLPRSVAVGVVQATAGVVDRGTLARLRAEHMIRADGSEDDILETFHDRIRTLVAADAQDGDAEPLRATHLAIAEALLAAGHADPATLAHHFRAAGDVARATHHMRLAAREAGLQLAFERAAELLGGLLALGGLAPGEATRVRGELAAALANSGQLYAAAQAYRAAADAADATDEMRTEWLRLAAVQLLQTGQHDEGKAVLESLLQRVGLAMSHGMAGTVARLLAQRARLALRELVMPRPGSPGLTGAAAQRLDVCWTATRGLLYVDGLQAALFHARHLDLALTSGDPVRTARAIAFEVYLHVVMKGDAADASTQAMYGRLSRSPAVQASPYARGMIDQFWASAHQMVGRFSRALPLYDQAMTTLRSQCIGEMHEVAQNEAHRALCLLYLGRVAALREAAATLVRDCSARPNPYVEGFARGLLGNIVGLAADEVDEAEEHMAAYRLHGPKRFEVHMFNWSCQRAELERYRGDGERAWAMHREDSPTIERMAFLRTPWVAVEFQRARACNALALAVRRRDPREQLAIARAAAKKCLALPLILGEGYGRLALAGAAGLAGDEEAAVRELRRAVAVFDRCEMAGYLSASRRRLAALVGGDEGRALIRLADVWSTAEQVRRPDRYTDMMAPGFHPQT